MGKGRIGALIVGFLVVVGSTYIYNKFIAPPGKSLADLGKKAA